MSGYAASSRLSPGPVRSRAVRRPNDPLALRPTGGTSAEEPVVIMTIANAGRFRRWLADARVVWAQTTFFLFNEEGWR